MTTKNLIAFKGKVTLEKATWDTPWGMYALFELEQRSHESLTAHPFKRFTKMRKGKVGTRFSAVFVLSSGEVIYDNEVMLKGWTDGVTGWKVTFWIDADQQINDCHEVHPFMQFAKGEEFTLAIVELQDDNTPVDQVKRDRVERGTKRVQKLSNFAAMLCRTPNFWDYLDGNYTNFDHYRKQGLDNEEAATKQLKFLLSIKSRAELDSDPVAANKFHNHIRIPYADTQDSY